MAYKSKYTGLQIDDILDSVGSKQNEIEDLDQIRAGAEKGATALQSYTEKYTGTVTGIKMNGSSKGTEGIIDLGTVITAHQDISGKQDTLISGTNIKTINGESILDEGDLTVEGGAKVYTWNWDGNESGTLTQDEYDGIVGADIVYISVMGGIPTQVNVSKDGGYRMIAFTQLLPQESGSVLTVSLIAEINEDKSYKSNISYILVPTKTSQLENDSNFVSSNGLKTINGESIVGSGNIEISSGNSDANVQAVDTGDVIDDVTVEYATKAYVDSLAVNYDAAGSAVSAEQNAKAYTDSLVGDINSVLESIING